MSMTYPNRVFSRDVMPAMLVSLNKGMTAILLSQTNPPRIELYSYANVFFCFAWKIMPIDHASESTLLGIRSRPYFQFCCGCIISSRRYFHSDPFAWSLIDLLPFPVFMCPAISPRAPSSNSACCWALKPCWNRFSWTLFELKRPLDTQQDLAKNYHLGWRRSICCFIWRGYMNFYFV